ncbi:MAG: hypothetical protein WCV59_03595 [Parcubacteria group bacterium]
MSQETSNQGGPKLNKKGCAIFVICVVLFVSGSFLVDLAGGFPMIVNWFFTHGDKEPTIEEILKGTEPTAARQYTFQEPTREAKSRTIDCKKLNAFSELKPQNPLCLNLYKTNAKEIDDKIQTGQYDRIILYGQNLIFDAPSQWEIEDVPGVDKPKDTSVKRDELAQHVYQSAYFNDQITMPALLKLYGLKDLSLQKTVFSGRLIFPYPAIYSRVSTYQDRKVLCKDSLEKDGTPQGCAHQFWNNVVSYSAIRNPMSMPEQRVHRNGREDFLYFDQNQPQNCFTSDIFMHETAHNLLSLSMYAGKHMVGEGELKYFNEHQAGFAGDMYSEIACGEGNVVNLKTNKKVSFDSIMSYNSIYPAGEMSSSHPIDNQCRLAALTQWNRILNAKNWQEKFAGFYTLLRDNSKTKPFQTDKDFIKFVSDASGDPNAVAFLNSYGCGL